MAVSAINLSRISFNQQTNVLLESLRQNSLSLLSHENRVATGMAFTSPSENPAAASQTLDLEGTLSRQDQILENLRHATSLLDATEAAIIDVNALVSDAHAIASQNVGALASADERTAAAELIADVVEQLMVVGNREFNGNYLFAGRDTTNSPFVSALGGVAFTGDTGEVLARVAELDDEPVNLTGDELFGALSSAVTPGRDLTPRLTAETRLDEVTDALGERLAVGPLVIVPDGGDRITIDLSTADTLGDLVDLINDGASGVVTAALTDTGLRLTPVGAAIRVTDTGTGRLARGLGISAETATTAAIGGTGLIRRLSPVTPIADLDGGAGIDLTGGLSISNGSISTTVDLSAATTVQDIINTINDSGLYLRAQVNAAGTGIEVVNMVSGGTLSIAENTGTTAAALGLRTLDLNTPLSSLNFGAGVETDEGQDDIRITGKDGSSFDLNLDGLATIGDVVAAINTAATDAGVGITASLATTSSGLQIADTTGGTGILSVTRLNLSYALDDLGLTQTLTAADTELVGDNINSARTDGVLTALIDLEQALRDNDERTITAAAERVSQFSYEVTRAQGVIGARAKAMQDRQDQTESASLATQELLSEVRDLDYTEAITKFQQAQTALEATLMTGSRSLNQSLLNFLG